MLLIIATCKEADNIRDGIKSSFETNTKTISGKSVLIKHLKERTKTDIRGSILKNIAVGKVRIKSSQIIKMLKMAKAISVDRPMVRT